jgi:hypothetical protein
MSLQFISAIVLLMTFSGVFIIFANCISTRVVICIIAASIAVTVWLYTALLTAGVTP